MSGLPSSAPARPSYTHEDLTYYEHVVRAVQEEATVACVGGASALSCIAPPHK
jgi:hypothetical protein